MERKAGRGLFRRINDAGVADDGGVGSDFFQIAEIVLQRGKIGVFCKYIRRDIHLFAERMRGFRRETKLFRAEIIRKSTEGKAFSPDIRRVRAEVQSRQKFRIIARGGQKLRFHRLTFAVFFFRQYGNRHAVSHVQYGSNKVLVR